MSLKPTPPERYVVIGGYWLDDKTTFDGYVCAVGGQYTEDTDDDEVFYWFESMEELEGFMDIAPGFKNRTDTDFVITKWNDFHP